MNILRKLLRAIQWQARKQERREEELKQKRLLLDCAAFCGDSNISKVYCERCCDQITVNDEFTVDEDGRAYCGRHDSVNQQPAGQDTDQ